MVFMSLWNPYRNDKKAYLAGRGQQHIMLHSTMQEEQNLEENTLNYY
jgi:hypothetical protein